MSKKHFQALKERLIYVINLVHRYPHIIYSSEQYEENLADLYAPLEEIKKVLGQKGLARVGERLPFIEKFYYEQDPVFDEESLALLKDELRQAFQRLNAEIPTWQGFQDDAMLIINKYKSEPQKSRALFFDLFKLMPILYTARGHLSQGKVDDFLRDASAREVRNRFSDIMKNHFPQLVQSLGFQKLMSYFNQFRKDEHPFQQLFIKATTASYQGQMLKQRVLKLSRVTPEDALVRGAFGSDCSMRSVPYHSLVKGAEVYYIFASKNESPPRHTKPDGYIFLVWVEVEDQSLPYILTLNAPYISGNAGKEVIKMMAYFHKVNAVIVPRKTRLIGLNNHVSGQEGLQFSEKRSVEVRFPPSWDVLDNQQKEFERIYRLYSNNYLGFMNRLADLITIEPAPSETIISQGEYQREPDSINLALIPEGLRALTASQFQASVNPPEATLIRHILQIDDKNIILAQALRERIYQKQFIAYQEFQEFRTQLGFQFSDLSKLPFETKAQIIFGWDNLEDQTPFNLFKESVLNYIKDNYYKSLFTAAIYNIPKLILALKGKININEMNIDGKTALHLAVEHDHEKVIEALVTIGANVQAKNNFGKTALHLAAQEGHTKAVTALLKAKDIDLQVKDDNTQTALYWAAKEGHIKIVKILLSAGAQVNVKNNKDDKTELHWAVQGGYIEIVEALVEAGADVSAKDNMNQTVLHLAAKEGYTEIVETLLKAGAPLQVKNNSGATPLIEAVREGHTGVVKALLAQGADVMGQTVLAKKAGICRE